MKLMLLLLFLFVASPLAEAPYSYEDVTAGDFFKTTIIPTEIPHSIPGNDIYGMWIYAFEKYPLDEYPAEKDDKNCEKLSKAAQSKYGGALIFLVGKDESGKYILGDYAGHFLNKFYDSDKNKYWYIDYQTQIVNESVDIHAKLYKEGNNYYDVEVFDMGEGRPPFNMIWHL